MKQLELEYSYLVCRLIIMYCTMGLRTSLLLLILPCIYLFLFLSTFLSKISPQLYRIETSNVIYRFTTTSCMVELKMGLLLFVLPYICSFSPDFLSKISLQLFKIETSNLVYRYTTTSCDMGLKMDILLFVLPCIFLSLYIFRQRYQPYALEAPKQGYSQIF